MSPTGRRANAPELIVLIQNSGCWISPEKKKKGGGEISEFQVGPQAVNSHRDAVKVWNPVVLFFPCGTCGLCQQWPHGTETLNTFGHFDPTGICGNGGFGKGIFLKRSILEPDNPNSADVCTCKVTKTLGDAIPSFLKKQLRSQLFSSSYQLFSVSGHLIPQYTDADCMVPQRILSISKPSDYWCTNSNWAFLMLNF